MVVISRARLRQFWEKHTDAKEALEVWYRIASTSDWPNFQAVRQTYPNASGVTLHCGLVVTVFNIKGNEYRLVTSISYKTRTIYVKIVMTHPEYDKEKWKVRLCH